MFGGAAVKTASTYISCWARWQQPSNQLSNSQARRRQPRHVHCSKSFDYQDCQGYAKPLRLFPVTDAHIRTQLSLEEMSTSLKVDESKALYMVKLHTSSEFGSNMSDLNAGILICLIDENGDSLLQRVSAIPEICPSMKETNVQPLPFLCFQRGSVDDFTFEGPKLGRIEALWVGLESGRWRLGGVNLTVIYGCQGSSEARKGNTDVGLRYDFITEDIIFGGSADVSMVELRPYHVTNLSGADLSGLLEIGSGSTALLYSDISNEETMREYADLKSSLLIYDSMLVLVGTTIAAISSGEKAGLAFLIGGAGGFVYLLFLQNSVDKISVPALSGDEEETLNNQLFGRVKGPIWSLALAFSLAVIVMKYGPGAAAAPVELTAQDILVGLFGFLSSKIAVVLSAFNPIPIRFKERN